MPLTYRPCSLLLFSGFATVLLCYASLPVHSAAGAGPCGSRAIKHTLSESQQQGDNFAGRLAILAEDTAVPKARRRLLRSSRYKQADSKSKLWLYVSVAAHFPSAASSLQFYLDHYVTKLKFPKETMLVTVNFRSKNPKHKEEYKAVLSVLGKMSIPYVLWTAEYDTDAHMKFKYTLIAKQNPSPNDWIVITDLDEHHDYPFPTAREYYDHLDDEGIYNQVEGHFVDRVSVDGKLNPVSADKPIEQQFPLQCSVVGHLYKGCMFKSAAYKAYFRSNSGNHAIVRPWLGREYFREVYPLTPYSMLGLDKYCETACCNRTYSQRLFHLNAREGSLMVKGPDGIYSCPDANGKYYVRTAPQPITVNHYKWHNGEIENAMRRYKLYSGDIERGGKPLYSFYTESLNVLQHVKQYGGLDVNNTHFKCKQAGDG